MQNINPTLLLVLKVVALGMSIASLTLGILKSASMETHVTLLAIGMFALALSGLLQGQESD